MEALKSVTRIAASRAAETAVNALFYLGFYTIGIVCGFLLGVALSIPEVRQKLIDIYKDWIQFGK